MLMTLKQYRSNYGVTFDQFTSIALPRATYALFDLQQRHSKVNIYDETRFKLLQA